MPGRIIRLPGFRLDKAGRLVRSTKHLNVSPRLKQASSKRVRLLRGRPWASA
jgi:hypothetical protein